jgi:hypothetical protein
LIVVFAIALAWFASKASAAETLPAPKSPDKVAGSQPSDLPIAPTVQTLQWDATYEIPADARVDWKRTGSRPVSVELTSSLANFDADADPDGWRARVVLRDLDGNAVVMRSSATFTLTPRVPLADHEQFMDADHAAMTWSMPLRFDQRGAASVTLPLRQSLEPAFGWSSAVAPFPFDSVGSRSRNNGRYRGGNNAISRVYSGRNRRSVGGISYTRIDVPSTGVMHVRVAVPTEGVFEAETPVWLRPSNLLSTGWPGHW